MWEEILEGMNNGWDPEVHNELTPEKREELWNASVKSMSPLGHDQKEEDIAWATVFLASDFAREVMIRHCALMAAQPLAGNEIN